MTLFSPDFIIKTNKNHLTFIICKIRCVDNCFHCDVKMVEQEFINIVFPSLQSDSLGKSSHVSLINTF